MCQNESDGRVVLHNNLSEYIFDSVKAVGEESVFLKIVAAFLQFTLSIQYFGFQRLRRSSDLVWTINQQVIPYMLYLKCYSMYVSYRFLTNFSQNLLPRCTYLGPLTNLKFDERFMVRNRTIYKFVINSVLYNIFPHNRKYALLWF